ncbi:MAG: GntR family transcriptional regulator [Chloroflexota bacterium]
MPLSVDKSSPIPVYLQIASSLERMIRSSELAVGAQLPSEPALAQAFGVNRNTVRHAIALLVDKGLLSKEKGVGTFLRRKHPLRPVHQLGHMTSFVDDFDLSGIEIENVVLSKGRARAGHELAAKFGLRPGDPLVKVERLRIADKTPFVLERQFYPYDRFERLLDLELTGSMYQLLIREFQADLHHSTQTLRAVRPSKDVAAKLGIRQSVPCVFLESLAYTSQDICIEVLHSYYRGDRYLFQVEAGEYRREMDSAPST